MLSRKMPDLSVEVRCQDIVVTKPGTGLSVTYRRERNEPTLVALVLNAERSRCRHVGVSGGGVESRPRQSENIRVALMVVSRAVAQHAPRGFPRLRLGNLST